MTVVLVHGNPESDAIWGPLVDALDRDTAADVVRLSPPGFGAPLPDDFAADHLAYRDWLARELSRFSEPVDLVGHDWGGGHVLNVVMHRPELVRSWVSDVLGILDPDYVWHDMAQLWRKPGEGEAAIEAIIGAALPDRAATLIALGMPENVAAEVAMAQSPAMGKAILALYRSAPEPVLAQMAEGLERAAVRPGLSILATADTFVGTEEMRRRAAERAGARTEVFEGLGHWWMLEDPESAAAALSAFWKSVG